MNKWFTSDTHFASDDTLIRENRPFKNSTIFDNYVINTWNSQVEENDIIYHLGDFANYNKKHTDRWEQGLLRVKKIKCKVCLIIGNNEERIIKNCFNNNFDDFATWCKSIGFFSVSRDATIILENKVLFLNHYPKNHKDGCINLFGHIHRATGLWKPFGLNVGCDMNHFFLFSANEIMQLLRDKENYWDSDENVLCM